MAPPIFPLFYRAFSSTPTYLKPCVKFQKQGHLLRKHLSQQGELPGFRV